MHCYHPLPTGSEEKLITKREVVEELLGVKQERNSLLGWILSFARTLREAGIEITSGRMIDLFRSFDCVDIRDRRDFYHTAKANLISRVEDIETFDRVFQTFWEHLPSTEPVDDKQVQEEDQIIDHTGREPDSIQMAERSNDPQEGSDKENQTVGYSPYEILAKKAFDKLSEKEIEDTRRTIAKLAPNIATKLSRRRRPSIKGCQVDFRRTWRKNIRYGKDTIEIIKKRRKIKKNRLALICDVSGSMDFYSRFVLQFMYGIQKEIPDAQVAVFSTRLTDITDLLSTEGVETSLRKIFEKTPDWSGGTNIGKCLFEFNSKFGRDLINSKTVVIIVSDGWDRGKTDLLKREMELLKRRAYRIIWLNPLLGNPDYQPLCSGMKTSLSYIDYFLPVHNLESLLNLGRTLKRTWS